jgi:para-nitrobenzyl esterase
MIASCRIVSAVLVRLGAVAAIWVAAAMYLTGATCQVPTRDPNSSVEVRIDAGQLRGLPDPTGVLVFRGIPFAAPPVGDGRWQAPKPPQPWPGIRQATSFGARCPQQGGPAGAGPGALASSEDCLFLNVWTTAPNAGSRRPVLVWFHGGGGVGGTGGIPALDGRALAQKGLVVVTVNYRLGLLGYLAHPALSAESPRRVSGNYALLDQIAALQWVQRNIATFGGDRSRVTVGGSSAGARGVATLLVSPLARGLFHRPYCRVGRG